MKKAERESFLKSFTIFFASFAVMLVTLFYIEYKKLEHQEEDRVYNAMKLCSFDLKCEEFSFDFEKPSGRELFLLYKDKRELFALFPLPKDEKYALKLSLDAKKYEERLKKLQLKLAFYFAFSLLCAAILSALFSLFALSPLRKALNLTEEFARDILHDLNTPLAALRLDVSRLKADESESKKLDRINKSIAAIASLGENLKDYLSSHENIIEEVDISEVVLGSVETYEKLYPHIEFSIEGEGFRLFANKNAVTRVFNNLIENGSKHNKKGNRVWIELDKKTKSVTIADDGEGIEHPELVFRRGYREKSGGFGLGLHIVKKLCDEMGVDIKVQSKVGSGSRFILHFKRG